MRQRSKSKQAPEQSGRVARLLRLWRKREHQQEVDR